MLKIILFCLLVMMGIGIYIVAPSLIEMIQASFALGGKFSLSGIVLCCICVIDVCVFLLGIRTLFKK